MDIQEVLKEHRKWLLGEGGHRADLHRADLREANLHRADLREADLYRADLREANLSGANLILPIACPEEGSFTAFKKAYVNGCAYIIKLEVCEDALRSSATTRKCRCSKAKVLDVTTIEGESVDIVAYSEHDPTFEYQKGEIVEVPDFNEDRWNECSAGIHFFITREEAVNY